MDTPQVLLDHHLKTLRLPTMLREYDKVAQQCATEAVDYPRFLLRLVELELLDRDRECVAEKILGPRHGFEPAFTPRENSSSQASPKNLSHTDSLHGKNLFALTCISNGRLVRGCLGPGGGAGGPCE